MLFSRSRDLTAFYQQMSALYASGVSPVEGVPLAMAHVKNADVRMATADLLDAVAEGRTLSSACARHPRAFPDVHIALIDAGERHGRLDRTFAQLAVFTEREYQNGKRLLMGMAYPGFLLVMAWLLPPLSVFVTEGPGDYIKTIALTAAPFLAIAAAAGVAYRTFQQKFRETFDRCALHVPILGAALRNLALARFSRSLALTYAASGEIQRSVQWATGSLGNAHLARRCRVLTWRLHDGATLSQAMRGAQVFPPEDIAAVAVAEQAGNLDSTLENVANRRDELAERAIKNLLAFLPVAVYLCVALYIGYVVIRFYAGYYSAIGNFK